MKHQVWQGLLLVLKGRCMLIFKKGSFTKYSILHESLLNKSTPKPSEQILKLHLTCECTRRGVCLNAISAILPNLSNLVFHFVSWKSPSSAEIEKKNAMIYQIFSELHSPSSGLNLVRMVLTVFIQPLLQHTLSWAVLTEGGHHSLFLSNILPGTLPIPHTYIL